MKKLLILFALAGCYTPGPMTLTVTHVNRDSVSTVYAKRAYMVFRAEIPNLPDSIKPGKTIAVLPSNDTCKCIFKRIK